MLLVELHSAFFPQIGLNTFYMQFHKFLVFKVWCRFIIKLNIQTIAGLH